LVAKRDTRCDAWTCSERFLGPAELQAGLFFVQSRGSAFRGNAHREGLITKHVVSAGTAKSALPTQQINTKE